MINYGDLGNFSIAGGKIMIARHASSYISSYYFPSGGWYRTHNFEKSSDPLPRSSGARVHDVIPDSDRGPTVSGLPAAGSSNDGGGIIYNYAIMLYK